MTASLTDKINSVPELPGIYKMLDSQGNIIYIGKSKCLKKRVKSYFAAAPAWEKVKKMVGFIHDIDIVVTDTHLEARLLECELIKAIRPAFNAQMKRDGGYAYLKVEDYNPYHVLNIVPERTSHTYGPFRSRSRLLELITAMKNIYPIQKNGRHYEFEYHLMPVSMDKASFQENREVLLELLSKDQKIAEFIRTLDSRMKEAASCFKFETASRYRDLMAGMTLLKKGINGYRNMISKNILLTIPVPGGSKLFFVSRGFIRFKRFFPELSDQETDRFIEESRKLSASTVNLMDEKGALDFRDILYSEILALPEDMVRILK
jgi:excinuclease ABC subunit C